MDTTRFPARGPPTSWTCSPGSALRHASTAPDSSRHAECAAPAADHTGLSYLLVGSVAVRMTSREGCHDAVKGCKELKRNSASAERSTRVWVAAQGLDLRCAAMLGACMQRPCFSAQGAYPHRWLLPGAW